MDFLHPPTPRRPPIDVFYDAVGDRLEPPSPEMLLARHQHLWRERGIQRAGLTLVGAGITILLCGWTFILIKSGKPWQMADPVLALQVYLALGLMALLTLVFVLTGWGLQALHPRSHAWGAVVCLLLLPVIPYGTIVAGYFLYCLSGEQAAQLFLPEYAEVRRATPHLSQQYWLRLWYGVGVAPLLGCAMFDSFVE